MYSLLHEAIRTSRSNISSKVLKDAHATEQAEDQYVCFSLDLLPSLFGYFTHTHAHTQTYETRTM